MRALPRHHVRPRSEAPAVAGGTDRMRIRCSEIAARRDGRRRPPLGRSIDARTRTTVAEQGVMVPLMLMCTARPEFHAQWPMRSHHTQITLNRLSSRNVREMITLVAARNALASESIQAVIERTSG